jgi:hypothetical protein
MIIEMIKLPEMINTAIEAKLRQQQQFLEYQFRINKAEREKVRKKIEAEGIQIYQDIIKKSLSEPLLRWQGIQATKDIAESTNSKIIIIGGKDGLPVILNTETGGGRQANPEININSRKDAVTRLDEKPDTQKGATTEKVLTTPPAKQGVSDSPLQMPSSESGNRNSGAGKAAIDKPNPDPTAADYRSPTLNVSNKGQQ